MEEATASTSIAETRLGFGVIEKAVLSRAPWYQGTFPQPRGNPLENCRSLPSVGMTNGGGVSIEDPFVGSTELQVPPLRFASVGMTNGGGRFHARSVCGIDGTADPSATLRFGPNEQPYPGTTKKRLMGFARLFRPTYAGANMGHPSSARWPVRLIPPLTGRS
jgi:hypothetical protein